MAAQHTIEIAIPWNPVTGLLWVRVDGELTALWCSSAEGTASAIENLRRMLGEEDSNGGEG